MAQRLDAQRAGSREQVRRARALQRELRAEIVMQENIEDRLAHLKAYKTLDHQRDEKRRKFWAEKDAIDAKRDALVEDIEQALMIEQSVQTLFTVRFEVKSAT